MKKELLQYMNLPHKRVVLLQSGGLDSTICCSLFTWFGFDVHSIFVDYGQNAVEKEYEAAKATCDLHGSHLTRVKIDLPWLRTSTVIAGSRVEDWNSEGTLNTIQAGTYVPMRNHLLLSIAASYAEAKKIRYIAGALDGSQDLLGRPTGGTTDKHPKFVKAISNSINEGSAMHHVRHKDITILTPVMGMIKRDIVLLGYEIYTDMSLSWSCYNNGDVPCCSCSACKVRAQGFYQAGLEDPLLEKHGLHIPLNKLFS